MNQTAKTHRELVNHAILQAELSGVLIVLVGLTIAIAVRGVAEIVSWIGRALSA
jgi:hypothetical protein